MSQTKFVALLANIVNALPINPNDKLALQNQVSALEAEAVADVGAVAAQAGQSAAPLAAAAGAVVETGVNAVITHTVGPFAGLIIPAADRLLEVAGGDIATAASHLLGSFFHLTGQTGTATVTVAPAPAPAPQP